MKTLDYLKELPQEEVFPRLCQILPQLELEDLLEQAGALAAVIPELAPTIGFDQRSPHHSYDLYTHIAHVVAKVPKDVTLRWAALLHDVGKIPTFTQDETGRGHFYGHAPESARMADAILRRLGAPEEMRNRVTFLIGSHMIKLGPDRQTLRGQVASMGWEAMEQLIDLREADMGSKGKEKSGDPGVFCDLRSMMAELREEMAG